MNDLLVKDEELKQETTSIVEKARNMLVRNNEEFEEVERYYNIIKGMEKKIHEKFDPTVKKADAAHKEAVKLRDEFLKPLKEMFDLLKSKGNKYLAIVEEKRRIEEQKKAEQAAQKEAKIKAELEEKARKAEEKGNADKAEALRQQAQDTVVMPEAVKTQEPERDKRSFKTPSEQPWTAIVTDKMALIKAVANGRAPDMCLTVNEQFLNQQARSGKGTITYPGVLITQKK